MNKIFETDFHSFEKSVPEILNSSGLAGQIKNQKKIVLKPNLTINCQPPCTTPISLVEKVIKFCQKNSPAEIIVAEGSGGCDTQLSFDTLGYKKLEQKYSVKLIDLNREERIELKNPHAKALKRVKLPKIIFEGFFINLPVLKHHDDAILTCAAKNLFGIYLNRNLIFRFVAKPWSKSELHYLYGVHPAIYDLNLYRPSDFVLVDASIGQLGNEIYGSACNPPIKKLFAGFDNLEVDRFCAPFLNLYPDSIPFLNY